MFIFLRSKVHKSVNNASEKEKPTELLSLTWYTNPLKLNRYPQGSGQLLQFKFVSVLMSVYYFIKHNLSTQSATQTSTQVATQHYFNSVNIDLLGGSS